MVHIGWSTVEKRVLEFAATASSGMSVQDFEKHARTFEEQQVEGSFNPGLWSVGPRV